MKNDSVKIYPGVIKRQIVIPPSKSCANRALIIAAIKGHCELRNIGTSTDVLYLIDALKLVGISMTENENGLVVNNSFPACENRNSDIITLKTGDGGTTNRFLLALLALGRNTYRIECDPLFLKRPFESYFDGLRQLGVRCSVENGALCIQGPMDLNKEIQVDCTQTSQFASALKLVGANIIPRELEVSQSYWELTNSMLLDFSTPYICPPDMSSLAPFAAWAALKQEVLFTNVFSIDSKQADACFIELLKKLGVSICFTEKGLLISPVPSFKAFDFDCSCAIDLAPTLAFLASYANGKSTLRGLANLRFKESSRLYEITRVLSTFGVPFRVSESFDTLEIIGSPGLAPKKAVNYESPADHRILMLVALFFKMNQGGVLLNSHHICKSFPNFFSFL